MSKVSILSFPRYYNYGTFLQLYAMQTVVSSLGYEPELIDYDPYNDSGKKEGRQGIAHARISKILSALKAVTRNNKQNGFTVDNSGQKKRFSEFLETQLNLGERTYFTYDELEQEPPSSDAVIVGSDQVWHPKGHHKDPSYFLKFTEKSKRIAYAPSFGVSEVPQDTQQWLADHIGEIPHLSIREKEGAEIIREITGKEVPVVLDPAYLLSAEQWNSFCDEGRENNAAVNQPYLFCYFLESDAYMRETALRIAKEKNLLPVMIPVHSCDIENTSSAFQMINDAGPREFVKLLRDAEFICTDSFHGTSFSLIFEKPFLTFKRYDNPAQAANHSRLSSVLSITGMLNRVADIDNCEMVEKTGTNFYAADRAISCLRRDSISYLKNALEKSVAT